MTERLPEPPMGDPDFRNSLHWGAGALTSNKQKSPSPTPPVPEQATPNE